MTFERCVSVIVPVRNGARYVAEALHSIRAQSRPPSELVVVDDGSDDGSAEIAARLGARVERQPPIGQAAARNRGVELSTGDLVAFLDADDLWPPDKLARQVETLRAHADVDLVFGHVCQFISPDDGDAPADLPPRIGRPQPGRLFGSLLTRRRALELVGPFSTEWRVGELMDWLFRAREASVKEFMMSEVMLYRRLHASNISRERASRVDHIHVVKQALDRRRGRIG